MERPDHRHNQGRQNSSRNNSARSNSDNQRNRGQKRRDRRRRQWGRERDFHRMRGTRRIFSGDRAQDGNFRQDSSFQKFKDQERLGLDTTVQIQQPQKTQEKKPDSSSSSTSDSEKSEDSAVRSLKNEVNKTLQQINDPIGNETTEKPSKESTEKKTIDTKQEKCDVEVKKTVKKPSGNVKTERNSKSDISSTSSSSSSDDPTSSSDEDTHLKPPSVEDVICLGDLEKFENLVEEEEVIIDSNPCILCDKTGHVSLHCQMICKNCNGNYHSLKDCPKPANLSVIFSNFIQFCLKQSCMYNPNAEFIVDENIRLNNKISGKNSANTEIQLKSQLQAGAPKIGKKPNKKLSGQNNADTDSMKRKLHSRATTPKSRKKRKNTSTSSSSESYSDSRSSKRKRNSKNFEGSQVPASIPFSMPYAPPFNSSFGYGPPGGINPLLAFSHMMGFNPASMDFRGNFPAKE